MEQRGRPQDWGSGGEAPASNFKKNISRFDRRENRWGFGVLGLLSRSNTSYEALLCLSEIFSPILTL